MPKISILIPAFNQARFLAQAIESALQQTHPDVEVVVIDDGSTDDTPAVAAPFTSRSNFRYVRQNNSGLPGARNRGLRESTGDYVCFLDSDDFLHPKHIQRQAELLDSDPQLAFVYCDIVSVDEAGEPIADGYSVGAVRRPLSGNLFQSLMLGGYFPPHTVLIRRRVLEAVGGFDPDLGGHADYDLWLRVSAAGHRACYIDEKLACYRTYAGSMSQDGQHMAETRAATFRKTSRLHPDLVGEALHAMQQTHHDLFKANQWLTRQWEGVLHHVDSSAAPSSAAQHQFSLLKHFSEAKLVRGQPDQAAIWDATVDGFSSKAIYLHAPAELYRRHGFRGLQRLGWHVQRNDYYSPLNDCDFLEQNADLWRNNPDPAGIDWRVAAQLETTREISRHTSELWDVPATPPLDCSHFGWNNNFWNNADAIAQYGLVRSRKPRRYVEVGCGWSSLLLQQALERNRREGATTSVTLVEPYPNPSIFKHLPADW